MTEHTPFVIYREKFISSKVFVQSDDNFTDTDFSAKGLYIMRLFE